MTKLMDNERRNIRSGAPWEDVYGYCRAVRVGPHVAVSGSAAVDADGNVVGEGDLYAQTVQCIHVVRAALEKAGATLDDVVRTRTFVTRIDAWEEVAKAHAEAFGEIRPAATLVEVTALIDPRLWVEIEVDAIVGDGS